MAKEKKFADEMLTEDELDGVTGGNGSGELWKPRGTMIITGGNGSSWNWNSPGNVTGGDGVLSDIITPKIESDTSREGDTSGK